MQLKISNRKYEVSTSFLTMVKYRVEYGVSILQESITDIEVLVKLVYVAIVGDKDYFHLFQNECLADNSFELSALTFYKSLLIKDCPSEKKKSQGDSQIDEFELLALCAIANIPDNLLSILNIFQLVSVINNYCEVKNNTQKPKEMDMDETKKFYNITEEKERQIEEYLKNKETGIVNGG